MTVDFSRIADYGESKCSECKEYEKCTNTCITHTGHALYNYIKDIDVENTNIGEFSKSKSNGPKDLICCGHEVVFEDDYPIHVLRNIKLVNLNVGDKFTRAFGKNSSYILSTYCKLMNVPDEESRELIKKLEAINRMQSIIYPIKSTAMFNIDYMDADKHISYNDVHIFKIRWAVNSDTHNIECKFIFLIEESGMEQLIELTAHDYNKKFFLVNIDVAKKDKHDNTIIELTDYGMIRPIEIIEGEVSTIIDGTFVYNTYFDESNIVGMWNNKGTISFASNFNMKAVQFINDNINVLRLHRKYIAPYKLCDTNKIQIR